MKLKSKGTFHSYEYIYVALAEHFDQGVPYHEHNFLELAYVLEGSAIHTIDDVSMTISPGDYFIVDYGVRHKYEKLGKGRFELINCLFLPQLIDETLHNCRRFEEVANHYQINLNFRNLEESPTKFLYHDTDGHVLELLKRMKNECEQKPMGFQEVMRCQLIELLVYTMRKIQLPNPEDFDNDMIQHVLKYVQKHYPEKLSLETITKKYDYSLYRISLIL